MTEQAPLHPRRRPEVLQAVQERLETGELVRLEGVPELEADLERFHGGGHSWFISSGTASLQSILIAHGIGPGAQVIVPSYTWGAVVAAVLAVGAVPIFADTERISARFDIESVERAITPQTRAILAVHLFGIPNDMPRLREIADRHGLHLFEDGSQAHGATIGGRRVGLEGDASAFSCMGLKLLGGTEGGYALFQDADTRARAWLDGKHPRGIDPERRTALEADGLLDTLQLGWRPSSLCAEIVRANLPFLAEENAHRRANFATLREALGDTPGFWLPDELPGTEAVWHLLSVVHDPEESGVDRATFRTRLQETGVGGFEYIPIPVHRMKRLNPIGYDGPFVFWHQSIRNAGIDYRETECPNADWRADHSLEFGFNWTEPAPSAMETLAACFRYAVTP